MEGTRVIDVDRSSTWPEETRCWAEERAAALAESTEYTDDLSRRLRDEEDEFRLTFGPRKLLAYHCTRLLPHELDAIRRDGLRILDETLVHERIAAAAAVGLLSAPVRRQVATGNVYAVKTRPGVSTRSALSSGDRRSTRMPMGAIRMEPCSEQRTVRLICSTGTRYPRTT